MASPPLLGQLGAIPEMLTQLVETTPESDCYRSFNPHLAPLAWYLGVSVYQETFWLRETIQGDADMTARVRGLFASDTAPTPEQWSQLPPKEHLLNWALEIQDENLRLLANPGMLPSHPLLEHDRVLHQIVQEHHHIFETMLMVLTARQLQLKEWQHRVTQPLTATKPSTSTVDITQGHYRIGAKDPLSAYDNELPAQIINLSSFRIAKTPISNAEFLSFMRDGGYEQQQFWSDPGWKWQQCNTQPQPYHWRQDQSGNWFGIGLNGPADLPADDPVMGINQYEAQAYAAWAATQHAELSGAVLQHEYQWEVAVRTKAIKEFGRAWEWCSNLFHPYTGYEPAADGILSTPGFDDDLISLRGSSIYTQASLRRASYRNRGPASGRHLFAGARLVFPPMQ
ncbi:MAG: SUMF1/EgtB/PvdO family nonheme iron enzyme [Gammaproteobacteria bacterium]